MSDQLQNFGGTAKSLARSPLGIIALFIVLVYGFASLTTIFAASFTPFERMPLICFLVVFPVLVLAVFAWLVSHHYEKLFGPGDFRDEQNYVKMRMAVVASLTAATTKSDAVSPAELGQIVETAQAIRPSRSRSGNGRKNHILWVDDRPQNNVYERQAFEAVGLQFTLALSTDQALEQLSSKKYAAIISDMGRKEGPREGYVLLDRLRTEGDLTPLFFYASSNEPEHKKETLRHGGQGCTNNAQELFEMVTKAIVMGQS
ncbi:response regulator [Tardiphaga alba]|uniref:Response regulator n=1 Tax=Tardiphaga alba TaxID=340268 RepID=A0ABX8A706_9BRAD|nr:response regulator [Tardiphaga alba]QUS38200.1 response regulator [Tardiphaga alba]